MYFQESDRTKFAELLVEAVGLKGTDYGNDFIESSKDYQNITGSIIWRDNVIKWIKETKENRYIIKNQIKASPHEAGKVFQLIDSKLRHF